MHLKGEMTGEKGKMNQIKVLLLLLLLCITTIGCVSHYHHFKLEEKQFEITELSDNIKHINVESDRPVDIKFIPKYNPNSTVYSKYNIENVTLYDINVQFDDEIFMYTYKIGIDNVSVTVRAN